MNGSCLFLVIVCLGLVLLDFASAGHLWTSHNFCFWMSSLSNGQTHYMFLHQTTMGTERSLVLFDSTWNKENSLVDCTTSNTHSVIRSFSSKCSNDRDGRFSDIPDEHIDVSMLVEPDGPCVDVAGLPKLRMPVRRTRHLETMDRKSSQKLNRSKRAWMIPGTLWCGSGNKASQFSDLGLFVETDMCCREHDHCDQTIASFEFGYSIFNTNFFTLSHCDCDNKFRNCLQNVNDRVSDMVGYGYFNLLKMRCFELSQRMECAEWTWWGKCIHREMTTYALLRDATNYTSTFPVFEDESLHLSTNHTLSFGNLTAINDWVMSSDIVTKDASEENLSVSVLQKISLTDNTSHEKTTESLMTHRTDSPKTESTNSPKTEPTGSPKRESTDSPKTEPKDSPKTESTGSPKTESTGSPKKESTDSPKTDPTDSPKTESTGSPKTESTGSPKTESTDSPKTESTGSPKTESTGSPKTESTSLPKTESTDSPKTESTGSPKTESTGSPKTESTSLPKTESTDSPKTESTGSPKTESTDSPKTESTDSPKTESTGSPKTESTDSPKSESTDSLKTKPTDFKTKITTDSSKIKTTNTLHLITNSPMTQTVSPRRETTDSPKSEATDSPQTETISLIKQITDVPTTKTTDSTKKQIPASSVTQTTDSLQTKPTDTSTTDPPKPETTCLTKVHIHPEMQTKQKGKLDTCESYKDLDSCPYQIPALQEKFGLRNNKRTTLYHCNCTARLARELAGDEVDKIHFRMLDFVSQFCFFLPQNCTESESCSASSSNDTPLTERWSKGAAVWRHLVASRRKARRFNSKRSRRKNCPIRMHKKCLRLHSKLHKPQKH